MQNSQWQSMVRIVPNPRPKFIQMLGNENGIRGRLWATTAILITLIPSALVNEWTSGDQLALFSADRQRSHSPGPAAHFQIGETERKWSLMLWKCSIICFAAERCLHTYTYTRTAQRYDIHEDAVKSANFIFILNNITTSRRMAPVCVSLVYADNVFQINENVFLAGHGRVCVCVWLYVLVWQLRCPIKIKFC